MSKKLIKSKPSESKRPSLRTIAAHVDLSTATVSLALRGDDSIPPETRQRILAAAEELHYDYVPRAQKTRNVRVRRLAFVMKEYGDQPAAANPFYGHILSGAEQTCREQHASLSFVILPHDYPVTAELPLVLRHDLEGILLTSPYPAAFIKRLSRESGCPIVLVDNIFPGSPFDSVMTDDFGGAYQITQHLIALGHTRIVMATGRMRNPEIPPSFQERYRGYCAACTTAGINAGTIAIFPDPDQNWVSPQHEQQTYRTWVQTLLERSPQPTAFFGVNDLLAFHIVTALQHLGWHVPGSFSVVGFDNLEYAQNSNPPLTTIHSHKQLLARVAVERLLARIDGDDTPPQYIALGTELVERDSSGPVPQTD